MFSNINSITLLATIALNGISSVVAVPFPDTNHLHHGHKKAEDISKRSNTCSFPQNEGLVAISPNSQNSGWALSPDQSCTSGNYCPYACPPGQLMAQWDTSATSYTYPESQNGGLYCDENGNAQKPFSSKGYCYDGKGTVQVNNQAGQDVAFCQTVLPGNEAMLIPTDAKSGGSTTIAVPGTEYWAGTAAHYYINPPGVSTDDGCVWGSNSNPYGNWSPYVAGANMDDNGNTFVKIAWNPIFLGEGNLKSNTPNFGLRITCSDESKCNGLQCEIDPSKTGVNGVSGSSSGQSQGASYCIVTASQYATANIEVFSVGGSSNSKREYKASNISDSELAKILNIREDVAEETNAGQRLQISTLLVLLVVLAQIV